MRAQLVNSFSINKQFSLQHMDRIVHFFRHCARDNQAIYFGESPCSLYIQRHAKIDLVYESPGCGSKGVEIKTVDWTGRFYTAICAETDSCTLPGYETKGWMDKEEGSKADMLAYAMLLWDQRIDLYLINFRRFQDFFWKSDPALRFPPFQMEDENKSCGYVVPIDKMYHAIPSMSRFILYPDGNHERVPVLEKLLLPSEEESYGNWD